MSCFEDTADSIHLLSVWSLFPFDSFSRFCPIPTPYLAISSTRCVHRFDAPVCTFVPYSRATLMNNFSRITSVSGTPLYQYSFTSSVCAVLLHQYSLIPCLPSNGILSVQCGNRSLHFFRKLGRGQKIPSST